MKKSLEILKSRRLLRLIAVSFPCLLVVAVITNNSFLPAGAAGQGQRKRVMEETPYPDCPVKIISITNSRHPIKSKESLLDDDDWMKGLEIQVINNSDKSVTHVGIDLVFERLADQAGEPRAVWPLTYGLNPFSLKAEEPILTNKIRPLRPGEKGYITLSDLAYQDLKAFLKDTRYFDGVEKMKVFVTSIGFHDKSAWRGSDFIRDPDSPNGWSPKEKPPGSAKKGAAFRFLSYHHKPNVCEAAIPPGDRN